MDGKEVAEEAKKRLDAVDPRIDFHVVDGGVRQEEDWWYVPVITEMRSGRPAPREFSIHILANVEDQLFSDLGVNVLFIPAAA